ncbi:hypothetical protein BDR03DRAFT_880426, partial [Suillus americanus]
GGESVLTIGNRTIALKHWPDVYRYGKARQWEGIKSRWTEWRDVVSQYRQSTPNDFWEVFSANGSRMKFTAIVAQLRRKRKAEKENVVTRAHEEFGDMFNSKFTYRKGNETHVMTDPSAITRRYQQLTEI